MTISILVLDKRVFGLAVAIILVNLFVLLLAILVVIANDKDTKKGLKALAMSLFTLTGILHTRICQNLLHRNLVNAKR